MLYGIDGERKSQTTALRLGSFRVDGEAFALLALADNG